MATIPKWGNPTVSLKDSDGMYSVIGKSIDLDAPPSYKGPETKAAISSKKEFACEFKIDEKTREYLREMERELYEAQMQAMMQFWHGVETMAEEIMRTRVKPPIKGELTAGKVKWRGLSLAFNEDATEFFGVIQRDTLYAVDGKEYKMDKEMPARCRIYFQELQS